VTLHISLATQAFVVQAGDRLVTVGSNPWDSDANKTIVVEARNGRAVIGYAGLAHVRGEPTGEWLTRKITGSVSPHEWNQFGGGPQIHLGDIRDRIIAGLQNELPLGQRTRPRYGLEVLISGWSYPRIWRRGRPAACWSWTITHSGNPRARCQIRRSQRFRFADPSRTWQYSAIGRDDLVDLPTLHKKLAVPGTHITPDVAEQALVEAIREAAHMPRSGVGTDVMSVYLNPLPWKFRQHARYFRDLTVKDIRLGYAPAIVAPTGIFPPQRMTRSGGHAFVFNGETPYEFQYDMETVPPWPDTPGVQSFGPVMGKPWR